MRCWLMVGMLSVVGLLDAASLASAQFAPSIPPSPTTPLPAPQMVPDLPPPTAVLPPAVLPLQPMTVSEFVAAFKPLPGKYEVLLIHPKTGCPVKVCFTLPPGCLRNVKFTGHRLVFDYKCQCNVVIWFFHSGKVWVRGC
jgi:hypothetical protein